MNLLEARNLVIEATGRTDKASLINSAINLGLEEVSLLHPWQDLLVEGTGTLVAGASSFGLASEAVHIKEVRLLDGLSSYRLDVRPKSWVVSNFPLSTAYAQSIPAWGYIEGSTLYIVPIPNKNYPIRYSYHRKHPTLTLDGDLILLRHAGRAVVAYATFWVFQSLEKHGDAAQWQATFRAHLMTARNADTPHPATTFQADQRGRSDMPTTEYWNDPFVRSIH